MRRHFALHFGRRTLREKKMVEMSCQLKEAHAHALGQLIDRLDYEAIRRCAASDQEYYDMVVCLENLRKALKRKGEPPSRPRGAGSGLTQSD
jgi:hypothetical protein